MQPDVKVANHVPRLAEAIRVAARKLLQAKASELPAVGTASGTQARCDAR
jgi:hypothetical protein